MSIEDIERMRLLVRFKVQLRRTHDRAVDLAAMASDRDYAARTLDEVEALTDDEDLLVLVRQLRARLSPVAAPATPAAVPMAVAAAAPAARDYRFGARGG